MASSVASVSGVDMEIEDTFRYRMLGALKAVCDAHGGFIDA
jgi:hypothetical protein